MIGWQLNSLFILELTSQRVSIGNVTRFRLLFVCRENKVSVVETSLDVGMTMLLFPVLHDLGEVQRFFLKKNS